MHSVEHDGRETAYRHTRPDAEGPGILYVHGSGGDHRIWAAQYGAPGPSPPAIAVDLSGHGNSKDIDTPPGPETLAAYAADVEAVARQTDASILVGNSLGGAIVQHMLLDGEFEPRAAILAGSGAKLAVRADLREWLSDDFDRAIEFLHGPDRLFHDPDESVRSRSRTAMQAAGRAVTRRDFLSCHEFDVRDRLGDIDCPILAVVGEHDGLTPVSYHEYFVEHIPNCDLAVIPEAAHLAMVERPTAFNETIEGFCARVGTQ